jgi:hypothetical protein
LLQGGPCPEKNYPRFAAVGLNNNKRRNYNSPKETERYQTIK